MKKSVFPLVVCLLLVLTALPAFSQTQTTGTITVRATDSTGALIPGVEVSISSPAMIGGARMAITDEQGSYRFTGLASGTYRVTFALPGFRTMNMDGNNVAAGRTITVPGVMEVSSVSEEITVTSQAPTIDLEQATVGVNWDQNKLDNLPYSRSLRGFTTMIPGLFQTGYDVGGSSFGTSSGVSARTYGRGGNNVVMVDGLVWDQGYADWGAFEEVNVMTASKGADQMNAGVTINQVLKSGSNAWHGGFNQDYQRGSFQSNNVDQALLDAGFAAGSNKFTTLRETYGDISGPVLRDRLWFYLSYRTSRGGNFQPGFIKLSDGSQQEFYTVLESPTAKLTYQLTQNQKIETSWQLGRKWQPYRSGGRWTPSEASQNQDSWSTFGPNLKYTYIISPRMTATAGINRGGYWWPDFPWTTICDPFSPCTDPNGVRRQDLTSGSSGSLGPINLIYRRPIRWTWNGDISYFSELGGKNNEIKFGYYSWWDKAYTSNFGYPNQQIYRYRSPSTFAAITNPTPADMIARFATEYADSVQVYDYPTKVAGRSNYIAMYLNDKITWNRQLTITLGLRFEHFTSMQPEQGNTGEGLFAAENIIPNRPSSEFPVYTSMVPRLSFAYDVTGTGRLAFKGSYGRYMSTSSSPSSQPGPGASSVNPNSNKNCTFNNWDGTIPFVPAPGQRPNSCSNGNWDVDTQTIRANAFTTRFGTLDLDASYLDEFTAGVEIAFNRDYSMRFNVIRKFDFPGTRTDNLAQPFEAYTALRTYPDPGPDNVVGNADDTGQTIYLWSVPSSWPTKGQTDNVIGNLRPGEGKDQYTAYEVTFNRQYAGGWSALGSYTIDMAKTSGNDPNTPNDLWYRFEEPTWSQAVKVNGQYDLPYGLKWAGTFSSQTANWYDRTVQRRNADNSNVTVTIDNRIGRYEWVSLWDNRVSKTFQFGDRHSLETVFDLFNTMNVNTITGRTTSSGSTFLRPSGIVAPRIFRLGAKYKF